MILAVGDVAGAAELFARTLREQGAGPHWISPSWFLSGVLILLGSGLAAVVIWRWIHQDRRRQGAILRRLSAQAGLSFPQRRLLCVMANEAGLTSPAVLLISRGSFEHAAERWLHRRQAAEAAVSRLRTALFN